MLYKRPGHQVQLEVFAPHALGEKESGRTVLEGHTVKQGIHATNHNQRFGLAPYKSRHGSVVLNHQIDPGNLYSFQDSIRVDSFSPCRMTKYPLAGK